MLYLSGCQDQECFIYFFYLKKNYIEKKNHYIFFLMANGLGCKILENHLMAIMALPFSLLLSSGHLNICSSNLVTHSFMCHSSGKDNIKPVYKPKFVMLRILFYINPKLSPFKFGCYGKSIYNQMISVYPFLHL